MGDNNCFLKLELPDNLKIEEEKKHLTLITLDQFTKYFSWYLSESPHQITIYYQVKINGELITNKKALK